MGDVGREDLSTRRPTHAIRTRKHAHTIRMYQVEATKKDFIDMNEFAHKSEHRKRWLYKWSTHFSHSCSLHCFDQFSRARWTHRHTISMLIIICSFSHSINEERWMDTYVWQRVRYTLYFFSTRFATRHISIRLRVPSWCRASTSVCVCECCDCESM